MPERDLDELILGFVYRPNYRPVKPKVLAKKIGLPPSIYPEVRRAVKKLVRTGQIAYGSNHMVFPVVEGKTSAGGSSPTPASSAQFVIGSFRRARKGFGFVRLQTRDDKKLDDIFIPQEKSRDASDGDIVKVQLSKTRRSGGKRAGEIVEIVERYSYQFVGRYFSRQGHGWVKVNGKTFESAIPIVDTSAKGLKENDRVVIELVKFPSQYHSGEGVVVEVLGNSDDPDVDLICIMREFHLPNEFPESVLDEARKQAESFSEDEVPADRTDLTHLPTITIDPIDARDFDDAISVERLENGHWRLWVHIADVGHFVPPGSGLDQEAKSRATSVYLPSRVIPMLPEVISNHLASLQPDRVRLTKSVAIEYTEEGVHVDSEVFRSAIRSDRRFHYGEVDEYIHDPKPWRESLTPEVYQLVAHMHMLAMILRQRRMDSGAIELTLPEIKVELDNQGKVSGAHVVRNTESHQIIEEFMLAANCQVAQHLVDLDHGFLRRIHPPPDPTKLKSLTEFVRAIGIECEALTSRFEIRRVVDAVRGKIEQHAVNFAILRSMKKATYSPLKERHYALSVKHYCHFTSPIRRYPDLTVHRLIDRIVQGKKPKGAAGLMELGAHCSDREQTAEAAERELSRMKLLRFLSDKIGRTMQGVITGVEMFGIFAQLSQLPVEGFIPVEALGREFFDFDDAARTLTGRTGRVFRLGDPIEVRIEEVDLDARNLDFRLASGGNRDVRGRSAAASRGGGKGNSKKGRGNRGKGRGKRPMGRRRKR